MLYSKVGVRYSTFLWRNKECLVSLSSGLRFCFFFFLSNQLENILSRSSFMLNPFLNSQVCHPVCVLRFSCSPILFKLGIHFSVTTGEADCLLMTHDLQVGR